jgi:hypothetical protein
MFRIVNGRVHGARASARTILSSSYNSIIHFTTQFMARLQRVRMCMENSLFNARRGDGVSVCSGTRVYKFHSLLWRAYTPCFYGAVASSAADSVCRWSAHIVVRSTTKGCHHAAVCLLINYSASALLISESSTLLH